MHESENQQIAPVPPTQQDPASVSTIARKRKHSTLAITAAFLAGALAYAIFGMIYNLSTQQAQVDHLAETVAKQLKDLGVISQGSGNTNKQPVGPSSVSSKDLAAYVDAIDCTTKPPYGSYRRSQSLSLVKSIDIYDGIQIDSGSTSGSTLPIRWATLPPFVDYQCNPIKITDVKAGDRVNIYSQYGVTNPQMLVQKAVK